MAQNPDHAPIPTLVDVTILGSCGNLALTKIVPALFEIVAFGGLNTASRILAVDRVALTRETYRKQVKRHIGIPVMGSDEMQRSRIARTWPTFEQMLDYLAGDLTAQEIYQQLAMRLLRPAGRRRLFYLAIPPDLIDEVKANLANVGFSDARTVVAIEKPFGPAPYV